MQAFLFLVVAVFAATVNLSPTDLFESNSDWLNNDMSNANAQPIFGVDDQTQMPTDDIWHDDGSNLLAYGPENRYLSNLELPTNEVNYQQIILAIISCRIWCRFQVPMAG